MQHDSDFGATVFPGSFSPKGNPLRFDVFIAYDEAVNARHAIRLLDGLPGQVGGAFTIHPDLYRFDVLPLPDIRSSSLEAGWRADLLIVAAAGERGLPKPVQSWLNTWASQCPAGGPALVGILPGTPPGGGGDSSVRRFLNALATRARIAFFTREFPVPPGPAPHPGSRLDHRARHATAMRPGIPRHCGPAPGRHRDETLFPQRES